MVDFTWRAAYRDPVVLMLGATAVFVVYHYAFRAPMWARWLGWEPGGPRVFLAEKLAGAEVLA